MATRRRGSRHGSGALLIALEGLDGAGTTTQTRLLADWLAREGHGVLATREPSDGPVGRLLRRILRGQHAADPATVALLFAADRTDHLAREVEPALRAGTHVVSDRYVLSSLAYQATDCNPDWVARINRLARPADLTLLLEVAPEVARARRRGDARTDERFDALDVQRRVARHYRRLAREHGAAVLDGTRPAEEVHAQIVALVCGRVRAAEGR